MAQSTFSNESKPYRVGAWELHNDAWFKKLEESRGWRAVQWTPWLIVNEGIALEREWTIIRLVWQCQGPDSLREHLAFKFWYRKTG